jgi:hypothetical protein
MPENPEIWKAVAMADHFEKIQKLPEPIPGVPNFRRVPGYKVGPASPVSTSTLSFLRSTAVASRPPPLWRPSWRRCQS